MSADNRQTISKAIREMGCTTSFTAPARIRAPALGLALLLLSPWSPRAAAEVTSLAANGFTSVLTVEIAAPPDRVYQALTEEVDRWWNAAHSYSGDAANFSMDATAGGCFCETLPGGGGVVHMTVVFAQAPRTLRLSGGLGPLQGMGVAGAMTFVLEPSDTGTTLRYRYEVGGYHESGLDTLADAVDQVQQGQLARLERYVETGRPD